MSDLEEIAAEWAVKIDAAPLGAGEEAALDAWLEADARNLGAFARASAALAFANGKTLGAPASAPVASPSRRKFVAFGALAAGGAGLLIAAPEVYRDLKRQTYATQIGETKILPLSDGSIVTLNTNSELEIRYTKERREIRLEQGEALFDVAKNEQRPFIVLAGNTQVRAVGTSFTVSLLPDEPVQVVVREGVVEVKRPDTPVAPPLRLAANMRAVAPANAPIVAAAVTPSEVARTLAWRYGRVAFEGETLKEAAAEFTRYSDTRIEIDAPDVENETVAGLFVANDPVGFAKAVAASFKLRMSVSSNTVKLSH